MNIITFGRAGLAQVFQVLEPPLQDDVSFEVLELADPAEHLALSLGRRLGLLGRHLTVIGQEGVLVPELDGRLRFGFGGGRRRGLGDRDKLVLLVFFVGGRAGAERGRVSLCKYKEKIIGKFANRFSERGNLHTKKGGLLLGWEFPLVVS